MGRDARGWQGIYNHPTNVKLRRANGFRKVMTSTEVTLPMAADSRSLRAAPWRYEKKSELSLHTGSHLVLGALPRWPDHSLALETVRDLSPTKSKGSEPLEDISLTDAG